MAKKALKFVVGERAIIQGMDDASMIGKRCTVVSNLMKDQGRYGVELCTGFRCKIKPTNLGLVTDDEGTDKRRTLINSQDELENPTKKLRGLEFNRYISPIYKEHQANAKAKLQNYDDDCIMMMHAVMEHLEKKLRDQQAKKRAETVLYWTLECMKLVRIPKKLNKEERVKTEKRIDAAHKIEEELECFRLAKDEAHINPLSKSTSSTGHGSDVCCSNKLGSTSATTNALSSRSSSSLPYR